MEKPQIEKYLNYRNFISDYYSFKKKMNPNFSHRAFSLKAGVSSPSHLKMVIDGKRNLSSKTIVKFIKGFSFDEQSATYFEKLVHFNQAVDNETRSDYFRKLIQSRSKRSPSTQLEDSSFEFLSNWFTVAIYVLIGTKGFVNDINWIIKKLGNKTTVTNVKRSLALMLQLELIKEDKDRGFVQSNGALSAGDDSRNVAVYNYHQQMIELASKSLNTIDNDLREFNGATVSISVADLPLLKEKIRKFRKEINEMTSSDMKGSEVYQFNVQLFPLTDVEKH